MDALKDAGLGTTSYYLLGLYLGLSETTLKTIRENYKGEICLVECLSAWLRKLDMVKNPSWIVLIVALRKLKENSVADKIETESNIFY